MSTNHHTVTEPIVLHMGSTLTRLSDDEFYEFCQLNRDLRIERTSAGDLIIMPPTGGKTGRRNISLTTQLANWSEAEGTGVVFDSSTGFRLANGAKRSPDTSWLLKTRWEALTDKEQEEFPPLALDFVVELRSKSDSLEERLPAPSLRSPRSQIPVGRVVRARLDSGCHTYDETAGVA
jgi:Uma2 family endonuclease